MIRSLLISLCMVLAVNSFSQHWNNKIWYFGDRAGVDFNTNPPTALGNSGLWQPEGTATMCDINGNLLFYTSGIAVLNRNHQIMPNGFSLWGHESSTQSALIVPLPGSDHIYYIFTTPAILQSSVIRPSAYSIVDMSMNGGLGDVILKNVGIHSLSTEKMTATLKPNGVDYWIINKEAGTNNFYTYSFTQAGLVGSPVISHAGNSAPYSDVIGYLRVSPNSSKLATANWSGFSPAQLFDFDNNTGMVSNPIELASPKPTYGVAFSPDNSKLYIMQQYNSVLRQYDLLAGSPTAIQNSVLEVVHLDSPLTGATIVLGPDHKIYLCNYNKNYLSVIDQPNLAGAACNFIEHAIQLAPNTLCIYGLPNNYYYVPPAPGCPEQLYSTHNISLCPGQTFQMPMGAILSTPGTYQDTLRNAASCDSIITIVNLTVVNTSILNTIAHICAGQTYHLPSGATFNATGIYQDTIKSHAGCDSVITTLTLTVFPSNPTYGYLAPHICSGQQYHLPSGQVVYNTGVYQDTIRNVNGCDSIVTTVNLIATYATNVVTTVRICQGQTYTLPSGVVVNYQGIYGVDTVRNAYGCDSIRNVIYLIVINKTYANLQPRICTGQTYTMPSGLIISVPGVYHDTLRGVYGCDSIVYTINLQFMAVSHINTAAQICSGQTYHLPSGANVNTAGVYIDTVRSVTGGCDSIITTVTLTVIPATFINIAAQICSGQNYHLPSGTTVNTAGVYIDTLRSVSHCDSIITTVALSVIPGSYVNTNVLICSGQTYQLPSGTIVGTTGIYYIDTLKSVSGCDSIIHSITLTVFPVSHVNTAAQICSGQTYHLPSGTIVNTAGVYIDTIRSVNSCDSIITNVTLSVVPTSFVNTASQICSGQNYHLPSGTIVNTAGIYIDTLRSVSGCDSIISTVALSVVPGSYVNVNVLICLGQTYQLPSGTVVSAAGIYYTDTLRSISGCDSIIHSTTLSVFPVSHINTASQICAGQTYQLPSGIIVNTTGIYLDTIRSVNSCDSIITTVNLSVLTASLINTGVQVCSNQTYTLPSGTIVSAAGIYIDTLRNVAGCDSVITTVTLSVFPVNHVNTAVQICSGQTYTLPSGTVVNIAGVYIDTLRSVASCDSVITTTNLSVLTASFINIAAQLCANDTYTLPSGTIVNTAGVYIDTVRSVASCDSIIATVTLSVFPAVYLQSLVHICSNETFHLPSGIIVHTAGIYIDTLKSVSGCDSIVNTFEVFVNDVSNTNVVDSIFTGQTYTLPSGETVSSAGVYQSILVNSVGCDSVIITTLKLKQQIVECITLKNAFTPNGDGINDYWILYRYHCFKRLEVNVYNRYGSLVYYSNDYKNDWSGKYKNNELPDGTYYYIIKVISFDGREHVFKDNVTILR